MREEELSRAMREPWSPACWRAVIAYFWPRGVSLAVWLVVGGMPMFVVGAICIALALLLLSAPVMALGGILGWGSEFWGLWIAYMFFGTKWISLLVVAPITLGVVNYVAHNQSSRGQV